jgi:hypothetical protein
VYRADGSKQTISLDDVRKLTFSDTELVINKNSGETIPILFTNLRFFSLQNIHFPLTGKLYVYGANGSKQSFLLDDVRKLTFSDTELVVNKNTGETSPFLFTNLKCFSLYDDLYPGLGTGIAKTPVSLTEVSVYSIKNELVVKSDQTITGINLYNLHGQKLLQLSPAAQEINISLTSYPVGIYILQVIDKNGITVKKIIKN